MKPIYVPLFAFTFGLIACTSQPKPQEKNADAELADALGAVFGERKKPDMTEVEQHPLGSAENPVRVAMPIGQRDYLARLVCENGERVSAFAREGSAGIGPYGSMMDVYTVLCDTYQGVVEHSVYLDMYHADYEETRPAKGFKALVPHKK
uniref:hypothetical protein n=1 Tax=Cellvibrio fontiphilus TaxID=1815559 RepID=UPI002B4BAB8C|nr:hypothetical protein [Cellvibrio fontiphilus]